MPYDNIDPLTAVIIFMVSMATLGYLKRNEIREYLGFRKYDEEDQSNTNTGEGND